MIPVWHPQFVPDAGVTDFLSVPDIQLQKLDDGSYFTYDFGGLSYNPADPSFGNAYTLTDTNGIVQKIDATTNALLSMSDRHGNTLTFSDGGISSNRGRQVTFERDERGRITKITDPRGYSLTYQYDANGNLTAFYDRKATNDRLTDLSTLPTNQFVYRTDKPHYISTVYDALGRATATTVYNADPVTGVVDDRIDGITDAQGKIVGFSYDITTNAQAPTETVTDQVGNTSTLMYDSRGNITRQEQPNGSQTEITKTKYDDPKHPDLVTSQTQVIGLDDTTSSETNDATTTYSYSSNNFGNVQVETDPAGNKTLYSYNDAGQLTSVTDPLGNTTQYLYDFAKGFIPGGAAEPSNLLAAVDPQNNATLFQYDAEGNTSEVTTNADYNNFFGYDLLYGGFLDANYGLGSASGSGGASGADPAWLPMTRPSLAKTTLDYFSTGDLNQATAPTGVATTFGYDNLGDRTSSSQTVTVSGIDYQIVDGTSYDADGRESGTTKTRITSPC